MKTQKRLADLYDEARFLYQAQLWQAVVDVFAQIAAIEPEYSDPEGLLPVAEREIAALRQARQARTIGFRVAVSH